MTGVQNTLLLAKRGKQLDIGRTDGYAGNP